MTPMYAEEHWYRARPKPEERWHGVLRKRDVGVGPGTRNGLHYELATGTLRIPVYATELANFVGREVMIMGKLVDFTDEAFGQELWIGAMGAVEAEID